MICLLLFAICANTAFADYIGPNPDLRTYTEYTIEQISIPGTYVQCVDDTASPARTLGQYCDSPELASAAGIVSSGVVFFYIICMELISILENYGDISPDAAWVRTLTKKLRSFGKDKEDEK